MPRKDKLITSCAKTTPYKWQVSFCLSSSRNSSDGKTQAFEK
jgi:hypothetical protein